MLAVPSVADVRLGISNSRGTAEWGASQGVPVERRFSSPSLRLTLARSIPVPDKEVPLEDLLAFKTKRADELAALRFHIDDVYQGILAAPDRPLAELSQKERLELALKNQIKVSKESGISMLVGSLSASFNVVGALSTFVASLPLGLINATALSVGAGASIEIGKSMALKADVAPSAAAPLQYVSTYHKELFSS